ncbi:hypothetical protein [Sphingobacterium luzhongxinii]|uniref:hypothetical protein n=1 Tax=Sphingobacterium luzhongxinii TaxID=2654181 RepID=UPI0013DC0C91|nr:hypothetical protein [Sphingobacterium sp. xlx-73]
MFKKKSTNIELDEKVDSNVCIKESNGVKMMFDISDQDNPKPMKAEITINLFGEDIVIDHDFSEEAEKKREIQREIDRKAAWTKASGNSLTYVERDLVANHYGYKKISDNENYAVAYVREIIQGKSTGSGKIWLIDCLSKTIVYTRDTNIISDAFILNNGVIVFNEYKREVQNDALHVCGSSGDIIFTKRKRVSIQIDDVKEPGKIFGHYLDKKYTSFELDI